jgi:hypothetical protein
MKAVQREERTTPLVPYFLYSSFFFRRPLKGQIRTRCDVSAFQSLCLGTPDIVGKNRFWVPVAWGHTLGSPKTEHETMLMLIIAHFFKNVKN